MKKTFAKIAAAIVVVAFIGISCTEDDITNPTITLTGGATMTLDLGATYAEPGFTANDDKDGDLTSQVTVSGTVNTNEVGIYEVVYTVSDEAGNSTSETRTVTVKASGLAGSYNTSYVITGAFPDAFDYNETVIASTNYNQIVINNFGGYEDCLVTISLSGDNATINQTVSFDWDNNGSATNATITGSTLNAFTVTGSSASLVTLTFSIDYGSGSVDNYVVTYTRM